MNQMEAEYSTSQVESEYSKFQNETSWYAHASDADAGELAYLTLGLVGEAGEFADNVKKVLRECGMADTGKFDAIMAREGVTERLIDELGDVFWYFNKLLTYFELDLDVIMTLNTVKLYERLQNRAHGNLMKLKWPFKDMEYEEACELYEEWLGPEVKDKEGDGVR